MRIPSFRSRFLLFILSFLLPLVYSCCHLHLHFHYSWFYHGLAGYFMSGLCLCASVFWAVILSSRRPIYLSFMNLSPGSCFPFFTFIYSSQLAEYVGGDNLSVTVGIAAWYFVVWLLACRLLCGGGLYVEVLGPSAAGELGWGGFLWRWFLRRVSKIALGYIVWPLFKWLFVAVSVWIWNLSSVFMWAPFLR